MNRENVFRIVKELDFDTNQIVFKELNFEVYLFRPSILSKRFKNYDLEKNFQIWLKENERTLGQTIYEYL